MSTKSTNSFATVLIGLIILAFMFTGYQQFENGGLASVGSVGGLPIKLEEYQQEYNRQIEFYKSIAGGDITSKQIESFKIKENAIKNIVQRKLMIKFAKDVGTFPSLEEVKTEIKNLPYFKTNEQFDVNRYKSILAANHLSPLDFEQDVSDQIRMKKFQELSQNFPLSKGYLSDLNNFRQEKLQAEIVTISKNSLSQFIDISKEELEAFFSVETNQKRIESIFKERKPSLDKPEEVTARHILLLSEGKKEEEVKARITQIAKEVTPLNFITKANQYTEDPSGKGKGGALGSFSRGKMVLEFEDVAFKQKPGTISSPVKTPYGYHLILVEKKSEAVSATFSDYREKFAREILQKDKVGELKKLTNSIAENLKKALEQNDEAEIKKLTTLYKVQLNKTTINRLDGAGPDAYLTAQNMKELFSKDLTKTQLHFFDEGTSIVVIKTTPYVAKINDLEEKAKLARDEAGLKNALARKMIENILKQLELNTKVKINKNAIQI